MRKLAAIVVALGLVAAGTAAAGAAVRQDDSAVTKDEIKVGVIYVDLAAVRAAGIKRDHGDYEKAYQTVIDEVNAKGGINGRKIVPTFIAVSPLGTDPAQEACIRLTEDEKVFAVMGQLIGADSPACYVVQHDMPLLGGNITADGLAQAKAPWFTLERSYGDLATIVDALAADGKFKKQKVGVVAAATDQALTEKTVIPALKKNGVKPTTVAYQAAPTNDVTAQRAEMDTIIQRMQADGVTSIIPVEGSIVTLANELAKTDYRPTILSTNSAAVQTFASSAASDVSALKNLVAGDVSYPYDDPSLVKCRDKVAKATGETMQENAVTGEANNRVSAELACRYVTLFAELAGAAGKNLNTKTFANSAKKAGTITVPGSGSVTYDPKSHTFTQPVYLFRFDPAQRLMVRDAQPYQTSTK